MLPPAAQAPAEPAGSAGSAAPRHPQWIKARAPGCQRYPEVERILREKRLHTVCEEAVCPNLGECWGHGTATFMLLGDVCTRGCGFCAVGKGRPTAAATEEPEQVAAAVEELGLAYSVLTSVTRDDLPDEGAAHFRRTVEAIHARLPSCKVEVLVPDFHAREDLVRQVVSSPLLVYGHNVETVPRLYRRVRPGSDYARSLEALALAKVLRGEVLTKSSLMLGLGESREEVERVLLDLRAIGCDVLALGQYLRPSPRQVEVFRYLTPEEFKELRREALSMGFRRVFSGPLVRSSYHAWKVEAADEAHEPNQIGS